MGIEVMEWPLEAGGGADRKLSLLTDRMGRRGLGCKPRKTRIFHCGFSHPNAQHRVLLLKEAKKPSPPLLTLRIPLPAHSSVPGLAGAVRRTVPSPQRDPHCGVPVSQPAAPRASFQLRQGRRVLYK